MGVWANGKGGGRREESQPATVKLFNKLLLGTSSDEINQLL